MSTVTEIVDYVAALSGMNSASGTSERAQILAWVNRAYKQGVREARSNVVTLSTTITGSDLLLSSLSITRFAGFSGALTTGTSGVVLVASTEDRIRRLRLDSSQPATTAGIVEYCVVGETLLMVYPTQTSLAVVGAYYQKPLVLVESGAVGGTSETTPSSIDSDFHEDIIGEGALETAYRSKGDTSKAADARGRYLDALERYRRAKRRVQGQMIPSTGVVGYGAPARDYLP